MSDSEIIWKFLTHEYLDDSLVIYLYICGNTRTTQSSINSVLETTQSVFNDTIKKPIQLSAIKAFLIYKKKQYDKGLVKVKAPY